MITEATYLTGPREHLFDKIDQGANVIIALFFLPCPSLEYRQSKSSVGVRVPCGAHHNELELRWTWSFGGDVEGSKIPPHPRLSSKNHCNEEGRFSGCPASSYLQGCIRVAFSIWEWIWEKLRETDLNGSVHPTITSLATPSTLLLPLLFLLHLISVPQSRKCFNVIVTPISILLHRFEGSRLSIVADWALFGNHMDLTS